MTTQPTLVTVSGPIAAGKSTVAAALAGALRERGETVALVGLDEIAEMALPTLPDWEVAHEIFASVTGRWLRSALTCVVAEGPGTPAEVDRVVREAPAGAPVVRVVLTSSLETSLSRARMDPTRGVSKERGFLTGVYDTWADDLPRMMSDVLADAGTTGVGDIVDRILAALDVARGASAVR